MCLFNRSLFYTSSVVQIIFSFWSFEISEGILRNQKIIIGLHSFSNQCLIYLSPFLIIIVCVSTIVESNSFWLHVAKSIGSLKWLK